jgi:signal transduction histidine kinase/CheY-like chemotaxis protein
MASMDDLEQYAALVGGWFWKTDSDHRFIYMSASVEPITGVPPEWHYGKTRLELAINSVGDEQWNAHLEILKEGQPFDDFRYKRLGPDGARWLTSCGAPYFDGFGKFDGYRGVGRDITDEIALKDDVEKSRSQLISAMEIIDEGFVYYDAEDQLVICNEKYRDYYPKSRDVIVPGAKFEDIIRVGAQRGEYEAALGRVEEWVTERMFAHNAGNTSIEQKLTDGRWLRIMERRTPDGGYVGMRVDISQLKRSQEAAESANRAKSNFLSTMSHEIRTPLNGVLGIAQLLANTELNPDQQNKLNTILSSGKTLLSIINDVLDMSRIEAGGIELEKSQFVLEELVSGTAEMFHSLADDKGLLLSVIDKNSQGVSLIGDPARLRQIIWNLLSNAIKFTDVGSVTLTIEQTVAINPGGSDMETDHLKFSVEDTGAGIAPDRVDTIFDAFTQEDSSITRKHGGTGLGLSIVRQLVELMGGTINVVSELGKGTKFEVFLPFERALDTEDSFQAKDGATENNLNSEPLNILLAEDNEVNAMIARAFLEKFGHKVMHVENGKLAVEKAMVGWADLIFMDIHMPEMNGIEATQNIRSTKVGRDVPIVGLTAEAFSERHSQFIAEGMDGVLTKPFTEQQLADTLSTYRSCRS